MKRIIIVALSLLCLLGVAPTATHADESGADIWLGTHGGTAGVFVAPPILLGDIGHEPACMNEPAAYLVVREGTVTTFIEVVLIGDAFTPCDMTVTFDDETTQVLTFQRGDIRADGVVNIADALFGMQYLVGLREPCELPSSTGCAHIVNMASVAPDFLEAGIVDTLAIAQFLVGLRDAHFHLP